MYNNTPHNKHNGLIKIGSKPEQKLLDSFGGEVVVSELADNVYLIKSVANPNPILDWLQKALDKMTPQELDEIKAKYFSDADGIHGWNEISETNLPMFYAKDLEQGATEHIVMSESCEISRTLVSDHRIWYYDVAVPNNLKYWWNPFGEPSETNKELNEKYMERTCGILLFNEKGEMLIGHITGATKGRNGWSIPKGLADTGEDFKTAAVRELFEETGITISIDALVETATVNYVNKPKQLICFTATINSADIEPLHCDSMFTDKKTGKLLPEIDAFKWLHPIDAAQLMHDTQVEALSKLFVPCTTLRIYDFDGTLVDTLDKERGSAKWKEITGTDWPYQGWWSKPESLDLKLDFKLTEVGELVLKPQETTTIVTPKNHSIVVTNRLMSLKPQVQKILEHFKLNTVIRHVITDMDKLTKPERVQRLVQLFKPVNVEVWEDREDHIQEYLDHGNFNCNDRDVPVKIHVVVDCKLKTTISI